MSIYVSPASSIQNSDITVILFSPACTLTTRALHQAPCHRDRAISKHHSSRHQMPYLVPTGISHTTSRPSSKAHRPCAPPYSKVQTHILPHAPSHLACISSKHHATGLTHLPVILWLRGHAAYNKPSPAHPRYRTTHTYAQTPVSLAHRIWSKSPSATPTPTPKPHHSPARPRARTQAQRSAARNVAVSEGVDAGFRWTVVVWSSSSSSSTTSSSGCLGWLLRSRACVRRAIRKGGRARALSGHLGLRVQEVVWVGLGCTVVLGRVSRGRGEGGEAIGYLIGGKGRGGEEGELRAGWRWRMRLANGE